MGGIIIFLESCIILGIFFIIFLSSWESSSIQSHTHRDGSGAVSTPEI